MLYPKSIESKLGFDSIRKFLKEKCQSPEGRGLVERMRFSNSSSEINKLLQQVNEMKNLVELGLNINLPDLRVGAVLEEIRLEGSYFESKEILQIADGLFASLKIKDRIKNEECPFLQNIGEKVLIEKRLPEQIFEKFDAKGELKDSASPELSRIRKDQDKARHQVKKSLDKVFKSAIKSGIVPENTQPTFRDGRFVIPVLASHKKQISGFIHDVSATGQTVYLEPSEVLETNNLIVELNYKEKREIINIYKELTSMVRDRLEGVNQAFKYLVLIDFLHAKAQLAIEQDAVVPEIKDEPVIQLMNCRHPILLRNYKKEGKEVVPLTITLDQNIRMVLISGPNAGGKSVSLKTVGLIQYMFQCGMLIPAMPDTVMGIFHDIFVDIGDEQSLDNDLSTYSSHLANMRTTLKKARSRSLVLIDEFGTGTDPEFGGAISEAILGKLVSNNVMGVITTHYGNLKEYAQSNKGIHNAAMQFDLKRLEPLYVLEMDKPGSSFALEVARNIGLPTDVITKAKEIVGADSVEVESLINKLTNEKRELEKKLLIVKGKEQALNQSINQYNFLKKELDSKSKDIIRKAKGEAEQILNRTNKEIEKTIRHIKESKAHKQETRKVRKGLDSFKSKLKTEENLQPEPEGIQFLSGELKIGDFALNVDSNLSGEVIEIKGNNIRLLVGELQTQISKSKLRKISKPAVIKSNRKTLGIDISSKQSQFSIQLNLRGKRSDEAISMLDQYIDDALLLGHHEVKILHGKGDGVLRNIVRAHLKSYDQITEMHDEVVEFGGAGITIVHLK